MPMRTSGHEHRLRLLAGSGLGLGERGLAERTRLCRETLADGRAGLAGERPGRRDLAQLGDPQTATEVVEGIPDRVAGQPRLRRRPSQLRERRAPAGLGRDLHRRLGALLRGEQQHETSR